MLKLSRVGLALVVGVSLLTVPAGVMTEEKATAQSSLQVQSASAVSVKIAWEYKDLPANMKIFEPPPGVLVKLWQTASVKNSKDLPISNEIADSTLKLRRGAHKTFVLTYKNDTPQPLYFFAAPHQVSPPQHSLGFKMKCLCINHAFQVGPGETWYRVVELKIAKDMSGDAVEIKHTLVGISKERMKKFDLPAAQLMPE